MAVTLAETVIGITVKVYAQNKCAFMILVVNLNHKTFKNRE